MQTDNDAVPTALPNEPTTLVDSAPIAVETEVTTVWVQGWAVMQEVLGESTVRVQPPHSMETMRIVATSIEAVPEPINDPLDPVYEALCRVISLAVRYGWNDPADRPRVMGRIDGVKKPRVTRLESVRASSAWDGRQIGDEIDVFRADPTGVGRATAVKLAVSDWPEFKRWFLNRKAEAFIELFPLVDEHREFLYHFANTLDHHKPDADGTHITITFTNF
jgi:hypothetical protein